MPKQEAPCIIENRPSTFAMLQSIDSLAAIKGTAYAIPSVPLCAMRVDRMYAKQAHQAHQAHQAKQANQEGKT